MSHEELIVLLIYSVCLRVKLFRLFDVLCLLWLRSGLKQFRTFVLSFEQLEHELLFVSVLYRALVHAQTVAQFSQCYQAIFRSAEHVLSSRIQIAASCLRRWENLGGENGLCCRLEKIENIDASV